MYSTVYTVVQYITCMYSWWLIDRVTGRKEGRREGRYVGIWVSRYSKKKKKKKWFLISVCLFASIYPSIHLSIPLDLIYLLSLYCVYLLDWIALHCIILHYILLLIKTSEKFCLYLFIYLFIVSIKKEISWLIWFDFFFFFRFVYKISTSKFKSNSNSPPWINESMIPWIMLSCFIWSIYISILMASEQTLTPI